MSERFHKSAADADDVEILPVGTPEPQEVAEPSAPILERNGFDSRGAAEPVGRSSRQTQAFAVGNSSEA